MDPKQALLSALAEQGGQVRFTAAAHARDLEQDLMAQREQGLFDPAFFEQRLTFFDFEPPAALPDAQSLIVVAMPSPQSLATFAWRGQEHSFAVPPTYAGYGRLQRDVEALAAACLEPASFRVALVAGLPLKLLAVHCGLAAYGRNNITYVPGLGSFYELVGLYSDLPLDGDDWQAPQMMARCEKCDGCRRACPSGAIPADRFLLRAERCLTYHNEQPADQPFPAWIDAAWHNSLLGCMACQLACPENKGPRQQAGLHVSFTEAETVLFLAGVSLDGLPAATAAKWQELDLTEPPDLLARNLGALLGKP